MALRRIKSKSFKLKKEATDWAKAEKKKLGPKSGAKWEVGRTKNPERVWEARIFREV